MRKVDAQTAAIVGAEFERFSDKGASDVAARRRVQHGNDGALKGSWRGVLSRRRVAKQRSQL